MNREIKFRAWNGSTLNYHIMAGTFGAFWINPGPKNNGLDEKDSACLSPFNTKCAEETIIMQFSGIHDANGKKMYEGDIVKGGVRTMRLIFKQEACQFWLVWENSEGVNCYEPLTATYGNHNNYHSNHGLEVIGNIYESPELLQTASS